MEEDDVPVVRDAPATRLFRPVPFRGNADLGQLAGTGVSQAMAKAGPEHAPSGSCVCWGIPFRVGRVLCVTDHAVTRQFQPVRAPWLVVMHTTDWRPPTEGLLSPMRGEGLNEHVADYVFLFADGSEHRVAIRRIHQIGAFVQHWGENCFQAVTHTTPRPHPAHHEQPMRHWGGSQLRTSLPDRIGWMNWLWAWENPHPEKPVVGLRVEPSDRPIVISAISAGKASSLPLRWETRRKALLRLPKGQAFDPTLDGEGLLKQLQLDMGKVISARPCPVYPNRTWAKTYSNRVPGLSERELLVEYTAHPDARFHLPGGKTVPVATLESGTRAGPLRPVRATTRRVALRVVEADSGKPVAVRLHVHGEAGEYLPPHDHQRIPNPSFFEDYGADFLHEGTHWCTYIPGETTLNLPTGRVYVEVSKGLEIRPVRKVVRVTKGTDRITIEIEKVLPWREKGWVSADTHVHFLSPQTALLEGAGEGINVVNLLATQFGEAMTNVSDFDGRTTWGSKEAGGDGEHLVRVGTENRQRILGHISLLGYKGSIITPLCAGGPQESALGDPIDVLVTEWARQCKRQGGVVVSPHLGDGRVETAAAVLSGNVDALEMKSGPCFYNGIDPYALSDWYRYLNCGYLVAAVGGTDKMSADVAVGTIRTYARIDRNEAFTYEAWMAAIRRAETFVTYGPLMEFAVEGHPAGSRIEMSRSGGTVEVTWELASVTVPMSRVEVIVNGEVRASRAVGKWRHTGHASIKLDRSSWIALLVRGHYADKPEIITAHSSPVMVGVEDTEFYSAADALTILDQVEGSLAYLDTVGTRAETQAYKRMRMLLTGVHRRLHNRMHRLGHYHEHTVAEDHAEHH